MVRQRKVTRFCSTVGGGSGGGLGAVDVVGASLDGVAGTMNDDDERPLSVGLEALSSLLDVATDLVSS